MKNKLALVGMAVVACSAAQANLLINGNLDKTYQQKITDSFFLPKPKNWSNDGFRSNAGAYEDEMSSESWSGPAPTPVTTDGAAGDDWGVFFKPFSGNATDGKATGHLYQDVDGVAGTQYVLTGWAGGEANALMDDAVFALDFVNAAGGIISSSELSLLPNLTVDNGKAFRYKQYSVSGVAPAGTFKVRARASMIGAMSNPLGGGQAFVVDDFELNAVPEPSTLIALGVGAALVARKRRAR